MEQKMIVTSIKIDKIDTTGQMVRAGMDDDHVIELSNSIAKLGLLEPIVVSRKEDGNYQLIAGAHRLSACKRLNWKTIPANIREPQDDSPIKGLALVENIIRRDMSLKEECDAVGILTNQEKMSISQVCQLLGRSRDWVCKRLAAPNFPDSIRDALFDNLVSLGIAEEISSLDDEGARNYILQEAIYGKRTLSEVRGMVETFRYTPSIEEAIASGIQKAKEVQETKIPKKACEYGGELVNLSDMRLLWLCAGCYNEIMAAKEMLKHIHTEGGETYDAKGKDSNRPDHESGRIAGMDCHGSGHQDGLSGRDNIET